MLYRRAAAVTCALVLISIALLPAAATARQEQPHIRLDAQPFFGGVFRPGGWLPVRLTVANSGADVRARVAVEAGSIFETTLELPRGSNKALVLYVLPSGGFRRTALARVSVDGQEAARAELQLAALPQNALVTGVLAGQQPVLPLPVNRPEAAAQNIRLGPEELPARREGLSAFDVLLVDAPAVELGAEQARALADWVRTGGQLLVGGSRLENTMAQLPDELRIATIGGPAPATANTLLPELGDAAPPSVTLLPAGGARTIATAGAASVAVQRELGSGSVTVLGWALSAPELAQLPPEPSIWRHLLNPTAGVQPGNGVLRLEDQQLNQLSAALTTLPALASPPLGVLIGLLAAYILIVGPGTYLVLRRWDRQAWGWVAIPAITLVFALGTYGYGLSIRGNDIILNEVSIVEPLAGRSRIRLLAGIFSPRDDTYTVRTDSNALFRPLGNTEFSAVSTATVGGIFEQGIGVDELAVAQWSINAFAAEQMVDGQPLEADITMSGNLLRGTVRNTGRVAIRGAGLVQGSRIARIGDLEPGQSRQVELDLDALQPSLKNSLSMRLLSDEWNFNQDRTAPSEIRIKRSVLDSLYSNQPSGDTAPVVLGWLDQPPMPLELNHGRVLSQQTALVKLPVELRYQPGTTVELPRDWLTPRTEVSQSDSGVQPCSGSFGTGWLLDTGLVASTLQLPPALRSLAVDQATLYVQPDGPLPAEMRVEVLDPASGEWVAQAETGTTFELEQPRRFFDRDGKLTLRIALKNAMGSGGGCIATGISLKGTLP